MKRVRNNPDRAPTLKTSAAADRLAALANIALDWLCRNAGSFEPPMETDQIALDPESIQPCAGRKAFGELGLALAIRARRDRRKCLDPESLRNESVLKGKWLCWAEDKRVFFDLERRIHLFPLALVNAWSLRQLGSLPSDIPSRAQTIFDLGFIEYSETSMWAKIDLAHYADGLGLRNEFPNVEKVIRESSLSNPPSLVHMTRFDAYGLTHILFHLTSFGQVDICKRVHFLAELEAYLRMAFLIYLEERDYDLCLELLAALISLHCDVDGLLTVLLDVIEPLIRLEGYVPGRKAVDPGHGLEERDHFLEVYHPTLVLLILDALCGVRHALQAMPGPRCSPPPRHEVLSALAGDALRERPGRSRPRLCSGDSRRRETSQLQRPGDAAVERVGHKVGLDRNWRQLATQWFEANLDDVESPSLSFLCLAGALGIQVEREFPTSEILEKASKERRPFVREAIVGGTLSQPSESGTTDRRLEQTGIQDSKVSMIDCRNSELESNPAVIEHWIAKGVCACRANEQASAARWLRRLVAYRAVDHMGTQSIARFLYCSQSADGSFGMNESLFHKLTGELGASASACIRILKAELTFQTVWALDCFEREGAVQSSGGRL